MTYKTIFSGRLEFGSPRSYEKVTKMYEHRVENFYRAEILLKAEEIFDEETHSLNVPRFITQASDKTWRNTINLLEYVAQYAIAGDLSAWMTEGGKIVHHKVVEPKSDKAAVQAFLTGRKLIKEAGRESEAKKALSQAIEKFERHAKAYERRGFVNFQLENHADALYDYNKSIDINPGNPDAYLGRAFIYIHQNELDKAIDDLQMAIQRSIPLQPIYWKSRRLKGELHLRLEDYKAAIQEFKLFTTRKFLVTDSNFKWRRRTLFNYGKALLATGAYKEAVNAFNESFATETSVSGDLTDAELLLYRGMALQKAGQAGYLKDWKAAADKGSKRAAELLETAA